MVPGRQPGGDRARSFAVFRPPLQTETQSTTSSTPQILSAFGPDDLRSSRKVHFHEEAVARYRPFQPTDPSDYVQDWYHHFNPYPLFQTLPPQCWNEIILDAEWTRFWDRDDPRYQPLYQRLMLEVYRLQQLANQTGLLRDKYRYRALPEPQTPKVEGSRDLSLPGPRPKHVSRRAFQQRLPAAKC